ncbi:hypothetical protein [Isoptericola aurantiacus]|uniref:hypothetical protein n=1 Tax=Isoptericola aurantiacus TaxID=3377839 RepID=UPI00383A262B
MITSEVFDVDACPARGCPSAHRVAVMQETPANLPVHDVTIWDTMPRDPAPVATTVYYTCPRTGVRVRITVDTSVPAPHVVAVLEARAGKRA